MAEIPCPSRSDLDLAHRIYLEREPRDLFYRAALELIDVADRGQGRITRSEALAVLLAVWNAQYYRMHPGQRRTLVDDLDRLLATHRKQLDGFRHRTLESLAADDEPTVTEVFAEFQPILGPVGTAKALHLLAPRFFPIWDQHIRRAYHVASSRPSRHADCYRAFMAITRDQVSSCGGEPALGRNPIKALDEYNYCRFTLRAPELATHKSPPPEPQPTRMSGSSWNFGDGPRLTIRQ